MNELLKVLSSNPIAITTLIVSFGALVASVVITYLIAFFQGRDIQFWPPKVGAKPENPKSHTQNKPVQESKQVSPFIDGSDADLVEIKKFIENAKTIDWIAFTNKKVTELFNISIRKCLENGGIIRLLLINPTSPVVAFITPDKSVGTLQKEIETTISYFTSLRETIKNGNIEIGYIYGYPPYRLAVFDRNNHEGFIRLKLLRSDDTSVTPTIEIRKSSDEVWFEYFVGQFEKYWKRSEKIQ